MRVSGRPRSSYRRAPPPLPTDASYGGRGGRHRGGGGGSWRSRVVIVGVALLICVCFMGPYLAVRHSTAIAIKRQLQEDKADGGKHHGRRGGRRRGFGDDDLGEDYDRRRGRNFYDDDLYHEFYDKEDSWDFKTWGAAPPPTPPDPRLQVWVNELEEKASASGAGSLKFPLFWWAPFWSKSGYGQEAISFMLSLLEYGIMHPKDVWIKQSGDGREAGYTDKLPANARDLLAFHQYDELSKVLKEDERDRPAIIVCHSFPDCWYKSDEWDFMGQEGCPCPSTDMQGRYVYKVGRSMFETHELPAHLAGHAQQFDEIWVPSAFNRDSFARAGVDVNKIKILPESINVSLFDPAAHKPLRLKDTGKAVLVLGTAPDAPGSGGALTAWGLKGRAGLGAGGPPKEPFIFLSIFKWESRKGWEILLQAFTEEFAGYHDVELHIMTHPFMEVVDDWKQKVREGMRKKINAKLTDKEMDRMPRVYVYTDYIPDDTYPGIYNAVDALVQPTRGEGWGRPEMEAMAMGVPVIATNWSGITAFINEEVAYPLKIDGLVKTQPDGPNFFMYFNGGEWAQPSLKHLKQLMRRVYKHRSEAKEKGTAARKHIVDNFSDEVVAKVLRKLVDEVEEKVKDKVVQPKPPKMEGGGGIGNAFF